MLLALDHVVIFVNDLPRAKRFYQESLGLRLAIDAPDFAGLLAGGQLIGLHPTETDGADVGRGPIPYFRVHELDSVVAQLTGRQVHIHAGPFRLPNGDRIATIHDSEGNAIGLVEKA